MGIALAEELFVMPTRPTPKGLLALGLPIFGTNRHAGSDSRSGCRWSAQEMIRVFKGVAATRLMLDREGRIEDDADGEGKRY